MKRLHVQVKLKKAVAMSLVVRTYPPPHRFPPSILIFQRLVHDLPHPILCIILTMTVIALFSIWSVINVEGKRSKENIVEVTMNMTEYATSSQ